MDGPRRRSADDTPLAQLRARRRMASGADEDEAEPVDPASDGGGACAPAASRSSGRAASAGGRALAVERFHLLRRVGSPAQHEVARRPPVPPAAREGWLSEGATVRSA